MAEPPTQARRAVLIQHGDGPEDDRVTTFLAERGMTTAVVRPYRGETLPPADERVAASIVYGGPFVVFEETKYPFLRDEARWIEQCLARGIPLLGICQGAQQIARVLGAAVGPLPGEPMEFGFYEITATEAGRAWFPDRLTVAQAHYHHFDIPGGAARLAASALFPNQAFQYGDTTFAFQFHAEVTPAGFRRWQEAKWVNYGKPGVQPRAAQDAALARHDAAQHRWFTTFLDRFLGPALGPH